MNGYKPIKKAVVPKNEQPKENAPPKKRGLILAKSANQCLEDARRQPIPNELCNQLWFEGEVCIMFSDTNVGKSILAVQIADNISNGEQYGALYSLANAQNVMYLDFELSDKQFERRYSHEYTNHYSFSPKFYRLKIDTSFTDYNSFEEQLFWELESYLAETAIRVLIVDNITFLRTESTEKGTEALQLMKRLISLKHKFGLSMLILAHTPKRDETKPITVNDLAGSKQIANFADSIFCIGTSYQSNETRYVKQLKTRGTSKMSEVWTFTVEKTNNFLGFSFVEMSEEYKHLRPKTESDENLIDQILSIKNEYPNRSLQQIADEVGTNKMKVKRILDKNNL